MKAKGSRNEQMMQIIKAVNQNEQTVHSKLLEELGISPIWVDRYEEVPEILDSLLRR